MSHYFWTCSYPRNRRMQVWDIPWKSNQRSGHRFDFRNFLRTRNTRPLCHHLSIVNNYLINFSCLWCQINSKISESIIENTSSLHTKYEAHTNFSFTFFIFWSYFINYSWKRRHQLTGYPSTTLELFSKAFYKHHTKKVHVSRTLEYCKHNKK